MSPPTMSSTGALRARGRLPVPNSAAERTFGYRRDELVGQPVQLLLPDDEQPQAVRKDGTRFPAQVLVSTVPTQWGRICPSETPEGPNCGLVKNFAQMVEISKGVDNEEEILKILHNLGVEPITGESR